MSYDSYAIEFRDVWKRYSRDAVFHRSLREDMANMLRTIGRSRPIGANEFWALKNINFSVKEGETVGLVGRNGAGKSTVLKLIAGVTYPAEGQVVVRGRIAPLIEIGAGFHPDLTGKENIFMNGTILGMKIPQVRDKMASIIDFSELQDFINMPVRKYSSGMYLRLAFSIAIYSEADIYLIDEILTVGDDGFRKKCVDKILDLKKRGKSLLIVSHDHDLIGQVADKVLSLRAGELSNEP